MVKQPKSLKENEYDEYLKELMLEPEAFIINLQDEAPFPLFVIKPDLSIGYVNPAFVKLTGFTLEELIGRKPPYP